MPGAGSKGKSCTDVKNNVPVNMRGFDKFKKKNMRGFALMVRRCMGHAGEEAVQNTVPVVFALISRLLMTELLGGRPGLIRLPAF